jgi:uncharacterized protein YyaL (SSP411 family)
MPNALASETSPYLLQHKDNPVDWRPWSAEAFEEARRRDVPVFLSVGYSTCYWCHVMEREVFENDDLARQMNEGFVCVKVDREERPDVDEHYMTATQVLSGQGGWPMSVFLTPEGTPLFAGTYFPPTDLQGRPGFGTVMAALSDAWQQRRHDLLDSAKDVTGILERLAAPRGAKERTTFDETLIARLASDAGDDYEPAHGGFGRAPKFPRQTLLAFLLDVGGFEKELRHTLDAMANGGIRDHLGGGFHRYSTDAKWLVPHFEIMLYDQAMLAPIYAEAATVLDVDRYRDVARRCLDFVLREMTDENGAFFTAFDAEVDGSEGKNYLWTPAEVIDALGDAAPAFNAVYGLDAGFNFADPHGPTPGQPDANVLFLADPEREAEMATNRAKLLETRQHRKQPLLDTKIVTSWNGLMIEALATCAELLDEPRYLEAATRAATWLLANHVVDRRLMRSSRDGRIGQATAVLDDYAHLGRGLLACGMKAEAASLAKEAVERFGHLGGFATTAADDPDTKLMGGIRRVATGDTPLPSGNGSMALLLLELGQTDAARDVITSNAVSVLDQPGSASTLALAAARVAKHGGWTIDAKEQVDGPQTPPAEAGTVVQLSGEWVDSQQIDVLLEIAPAFHLYSPRHKGSEHKLELSSTDNAAIAHVDYPPDDAGIYRGKIRLAAHLVEPMAAGGEIELALAYQACDDSRCLPAVRKVFVARLADADGNGAA